MSKAQGNSKENASTYTPTEIAAKDALQIESGKDTNILGSTVQGDKVTAKIGGNLKIETLQEKETYEEKNTSAGFDLSWDIRAGKFSKPTFGLSAGRGTIDSHYRSARGQSGIFAGKGGFDIYVEKNTDLKGAVIASEADAGKNRLSTGTFSFSDLENGADYSAKSIGAEYHHYGNYDKMSRQEKNKVYNTIGLSPSLSMPAKGDANSTTCSAVARGTIDIRENPTQDISVLSRDTANSLNELGRIFDKQKIEEQQELAKVFGEEAFRLAHNLPDDGSGRKVAVHAIIGGIMSQITGAGFASGAIGAGVNEALINNLKGLDPGTAQIVSAIAGAAAAKAVGGNAGAGASAAASGTKNNWLGKEQETFVEELSEALESQDQEKINEVLAKYYALSNYYDQHGMTGEGDDQRITASLYPLLECLIPEDKRYWLDGGLNYTLNNIVCMDPALFALANQKRHDLEVNGYAEGVIPSNDYRVAERAAEIKMNSEIPKTNYATEESSADAKAVGIATDLVAAKVLSYDLPLTPSAYLYARYGEGESLNFSEDSVVSYEIVHSQDFIEEIRTRGRDIPVGSSETRFTSVQMTIQSGIDPWLTFGTIKLAITITHNMDSTYTVEGVAEDLYNFEHLTLDGWKKIVEIGNNIAYDLQKKGEVRPYTWKANIHATIHE